MGKRGRPPKNPSKTTEGEVVKKKKVDAEGMKVRIGRARDKWDQHRLACGGTNYQFASHLLELHTERCPKAPYEGPEDKMKNPTARKGTGDVHITVNGQHAKQWRHLQKMSGYETSELDFLGWLLSLASEQMLGMSSRTLSSAEPWTGWRFLVDGGNEGIENQEDKEKKVFDNEKPLETSNSMLEDKDGDESDATIDAPLEPTEGEPPKKKRGPKPKPGKARKKKGLPGEKVKRLPFLQCIPCKRKFKERYYFNMHQHKFHGAEPPAKERLCSYCGKAFGTDKIVKVHQEAVHGKVMLTPCPVCNKLLRPGNYTRHMELSHTEQKVCCDVCGIVLKNKRALYYHQRNVHQRLGKSMCDWPGCGKVFNRISNLQTHRLIHSGEMPIQCKFCDYRCRQTNSLNWHMKRNHPDRVQGPASIRGELYTDYRNVALELRDPLDETSEMPALTGLKLPNKPEEPEPSAFTTSIPTEPDPAERSSCSGPLPISNSSSSSSSNSNYTIYASNSTLLPGHLPQQASVESPTDQTPLFARPMEPMPAHSRPTNMNPIPGPIMTPVPGPGHYMTPGHFIPPRMPDLLTPMPIPNISFGGDWIPMDLGKC